MKGRTPPPVKLTKTTGPIVSVIGGTDTSVCIYVDGRLFADGDVEGFDLVELLEAAGAHAHYLEGSDRAYPYTGEWPSLLRDALRLPVIHEDDEGNAYEDPTATLASINGITLE